jgi:hypothetical protein
MKTYILFDYINQDIVTKGTLKEIKDVLIEIGEENEWDNLNEVHSLDTEEEISKWVYENLDFYLEE